MRLSPDQVSTIVACVRQNFGDDSSVALFGSRLDDAARGGDVDLLVETETRPTLRQRALATMALEQALNLPVDIVATQRGTPGSAFERIARIHAQALAAGAGKQGARLPPKEVHRD
jgi:predicted nucleotidyltransferase